MSENDGENDKSLEERKEILDGLVKEQDNIEDSRENNDLPKTVLSSKMLMNPLFFTLNKYPFHAFFTEEDKVYKIQILLTLLFFKFSFKYL